MFHRFGSPSPHLVIGSILAFAVTLVSLPGRTQSAGDIVVIGDSPSEWAEFQGYWNQLINLSTPPPAAVPDRRGGSGQQEFGQAEVDPQLLTQELTRNLQVKGLRLAPIIKLNGSSEVIGTLTNGNKDSVTVSGVNFEIVDSKGNLLQTGSAAPEPATLQPGQTVTFKQTLTTVPPDAGYKVRLSDYPFVIQGGI